MSTRVISLKKTIRKMVMNPFISVQKEPKMSINSTTVEEFMDVNYKYAALMSMFTEEEFAELMTDVVMFMREKEH
jgi:hypothetical protein